ncbi:hypothetical protein NHJ13734_003011 [Beauveria thailandica]
MSTDEDASQLAIDDGALSFNDVFTTTSATPEQPLIASEITKSLFDPNNVWDFQANPSLESYNLTTPSNSASQPDFIPQTWAFQGFENNQPAASSASSQSATAGINPINLFSNSSDPNGFAPPAPSEDGRASNASSRPPVTQPPRYSTSLAPAVEEKLRNIAMPGGLPRHSLHMSSPDSSRSETKAGIISSPEDATDTRHESRKRKVTSEPEDDDDNEDEDKPVKKTAHNMIEKRYRTNINDKIAALRDSVPSLRIMSKSARGEDTTQDREELHGLTPAHKLNKATVLSKATEYIRHLEKRNCRLLEENNAMQARIAAFEKLFMAGAMNGSISSHQPPPAQMSFPQEGQPGFMPSPMPQQENGETPAGMIQVPDDMRRILAAQMAAGQPYPVPQQQAFQGSNPAVVRQQQIQQQQVQQQQQGAWSNASPYFGKLMVGSLAGLMIIEAFREEEVSNETPDGRGLAAIPLQLLRTAAKGLDLQYHGYHLHTSVQSILFFGIFLWIFVPSLFQSSSDNPKKQGAGHLRAAPSMAAPIHVRRQAWATAIQTVWVPRHNFFLEVAALLLKMAKLSLRNAIGWHGYAMLTGTTQEEETARIKAWSIALDSQLAGGDVEVCTRRLLLTLLASGTLPDTPARLMLKALHVRVLLWKLGQTRFVPANMIAAKIARSCWNGARQLNQLLIQLRSDPAKPHEDELPEYLTALVQRDCDEVLTDAVVHRAYNLALHKDTTEGVSPNIDGMDSVVYDVYVGTPLDAAAAWFSTCLLHDVLSEALDTKDINRDNLDTAFNVAPLGSIAKLRASLACAALIDESRGASIATSLKLLGTERLESPLAEPTLIIGASSHASNPDLLLTLRCAVAIGQLARASRDDTFVVSPSQTLRIIEASLHPAMASAMTLLGFAAVMNLLECVMAQKRSSGATDADADAVDASLEKLAATMRVWIGGPCGTNAGIDADIRAKVVERCLVITKSLVGMDVDTGYGTSTDVSDDESD